MNIADQLEGNVPFLNVKLFDLGATPITVATVAVMLVVMLATGVVSWVVTRAIRKAFKLRGLEDEGTLGVVTRLTHYLILGAGLFVALRIAGIDLTALFAAGAVFAVALGFAMQNITANFVSGVILLGERSITETDILEVEGTVVRVVRMGARATVARTRDEEELIIPNSTLVQSTVKNLTLSDDVYRIRSKVGVSYDSDMAAVERVLKEAAASVTGLAKDRPSIVQLIDFGDSSVVWEVSVWAISPWTGPGTRSDLNKAIWWGLKAADITIAYPQLDVHVKAAAQPAPSGVSENG